MPQDQPGRRGGSTRLEARSHPDQARPFASLPAPRVGPASREVVTRQPSGRSRPSIGSGRRCEPRCPGPAGRRPPALTSDSEDRSRPRCGSRSCRRPRSAGVGSESGRAEDRLHGQAVALQVAERVVAHRRPCRASAVGQPLGVLPVRAARGRRAGGGVRPVSRSRARGRRRRAARPRRPRRRRGATGPARSGGRPPGVDPVVAERHGSTTCAASTAAPSAFSSTVSSTAGWKPRS